MELYDERPISVQLPDTIEATIVEADAVVKGQTASSQLQAGDARQWRPRHGPAAHRRRHPDRRRRLRADLRPPRRLDGFPFRPDHRHDPRRPQGGAAPAPRLRRGRAAAGVEEGPGRLRVDGRQARRADAGRGTAQRAARLGHAARGRRRDRGRSDQAALDRRSARRHHQLPPRHPAFRHLDRGRGAAGPTARPRSATAWSTSR